MRVLLLTILVALVALAPFVAACMAGDDTGDCSGQVYDLGGHAYYVLVGPTPDRGWLYVESNGEPGLQRGGCYWGGADPCQTESPNGPDMLMY